MNSARLMEDNVVGRGGTPQRRRRKKSESETCSMLERRHLVLRLGSPKDDSPLLVRTAQYHQAGTGAAPCLRRGNSRARQVYRGGSATTATAVVVDRRWRMRSDGGRWSQSQTGLGLDTGGIGLGGSVPERIQLTAQQDGDQYIDLRICITQFKLSDLYCKTLPALDRWFSG